MVVDKGGRRGVKRRRGEKGLFSNRAALVC